MRYLKTASAGAHMPVMGGWTRPVRRVLKKGECVLTVIANSHRCRPPVDRVDGAWPYLGAAELTRATSSVNCV